MFVLVNEEPSFGAEGLRSGERGERCDEELVDDEVDVRAGASGTGCEKCSRRRVITCC